MSEIRIFESLCDNGLLSRIMMFKKTHYFNEIISFSQSHLGKGYVIRFALKYLMLYFQHRKIFINKTNES